MAFFPVITSLYLLLAQSRSEVKINNTVNSQTTNVSVSTKSNSNTSVIINNNKFEIEGDIDSISDNTFTVSGQSVSAEHAKLAEFKNQGFLTVGNHIKVSGTIKNSILYAEAVSGNSPVTTSSAPPSPTLSASPAISPTPSKTTGENPAGDKNQSALPENLIIKTLESLIHFLSEVF